VTLLDCSHGTLYNAVDGEEPELRYASLKDALLQWCENVDGPWDPDDVDDVPAKKRLQIREPANPMMCKMSVSLGTRARG